MASVEDLVPVANGRFLVGSSYRASSIGLFLIDTVAKTARPVTLSVAARPDALYAGCAAPDLERLYTHGLASTAAPDGTAIVYAVNHGGRESVEVFRLDPRAGAAAWIGCVLMPDGASGNAVVPLSRGRLAISRFAASNDVAAIRAVIAGEVTGAVYIWTPGRGFAVLPHSALSGGNGLAVSPDGTWLFVNAYGGRAVWRLPLDGEGQPTRTDLPFLPDNLRWSSDGALLVTGQYVTSRNLAALHDWATFRLDPRTMVATPIVAERGSAAFDSATTAVQVGRTLWFGSFRGNRIAYKAW